MLFLNFVFVFDFDFENMEWHKMRLRRGRGGRDVCMSIFIYKNKKIRKMKMVEYLSS